MYLSETNPSKRRIFVKSRWINWANSNIRSVFSLKRNEMKHAAQANWNKFNHQRCGNTSAHKLNFYTELQSSKTNWKTHVIYDHLPLLYAELVWHFFVKYQRQYGKQLSKILEVSANRRLYSSLPSPQLALWLFKGNKVSYVILGGNHKENNGLRWCGNLFKR